MKRQPLIVTEEQARHMGGTRAMLQQMYADGCVLRAFDGACYIFDRQQVPEQMRYQWNDEAGEYELQAAP